MYDKRVRKTDRKLLNRILILLILLMNSIPPLHSESLTPTAAPMENLTEKHVMRCHIVLLNIKGQLI